MWKFTGISSASHASQNGSQAGSFRYGSPNASGVSHIVIPVIPISRIRSSSFTAAGMSQNGTKPCGNSRPVARRLELRHRVVVDRAADVPQLLVLDLDEILRAEPGHVRVHDLLRDPPACPAAPAAPTGSVAAADISSNEPSPITPYSFDPSSFTTVNPGGPKSICDCPSGDSAQRTAPASFVMMCGTLSLNFAGAREVHRSGGSV